MGVRRPGTADAEVRPGSAGAAKGHPVDGGTVDPDGRKVPVETQKLRVLIHFGHRNFMIFLYRGTFVSG